MGRVSELNIYFSDFFRVNRRTVERYGAFDISLIADLPLFVDPFLLFTSKKRKYSELHDRIIDYLRFLREKSANDGIDPGLLRAWYRFPEIKQNWLGFSAEGNNGHGLGSKFGNALHVSLGKLFKSFGDERVTKGSHLEKLCLISDGVGRDNISDFTNNLILEFLLDYTQEFARRQIDASRRRKFTINKVRFNYKTESWESGTYNLPCYREDFVLLTPRDILTKEETWINKSDLIRDFEKIPDAMPNDVLRAQVNNYLRKMLPKGSGKKGPTKEEERDAKLRTILQYPEMIDYFIKFKEDHGDDAESVSAERVAFSQQLYIKQFKELAEFLKKTTPFYETPAISYK